MHCEAPQFPRDKRAHRFFHMAPEDMLYPEGRTDAFTIVEICIQESAAHNWGFRGQLGDEIQLNCRVDV